MKSTNPAASTSFRSSANAEAVVWVNSDYKFNVEGKPTDVFSLRKGMIVGGEKIVESPTTQVAANTAFTGTVPKPAPVVAAALAPVAEPAPRRVAATPAPAPVAELEPAPAPAKLPKTGSPLPLTGMLGLLFTGVGLGLRKLPQS